MSAATKEPGRVGRPPGPDRDSLAKGRQYLELMTKYDVPVAMIAERDGVTAAWVWGLMKKARAADGAGEALTAAGQVPVARATRKMAASTLLHRIWIAMRDTRCFKLLGAEGRELWTNVMMEIRNASVDGMTLPFGPGLPCRSMAEFADLFDRPAADVEALCDRGFLLALEGGGVAMPFRFGVRREATVARKTGDPRQAYMMHLVPGMASQQGAADSTETVDSDSTETRIFVESDSTEIPPGPSTETPFSVESGGVARTVDVDVGVKDNQLLNININNPGRAPDSTEMGVFVESDSTEISPGDSTDINSQRSALVALAMELTALAGLDRRPNGDEIGLVGSWLNAGASGSLSAAAAAETMRAVVENRVRHHAATPQHLRYFDKEMRKALAAATHRPLPAGVAQPSRPAAAAAPEVDELDPAAEVGNGPAAQWARVRRRVRDAVGRADWRAWLLDLALVEVSDEEVRLSAKSKFLADAVANRFGDRLRAVWRTEIPDLRWVRICVAAPA